MANPSKPVSAFCKAFAALILLGACTFSVQAQDSWQKRITIYGWLPDLEGTTQFPTGGSGPDLEVDASKLVSDLNFTLMGSIDVNKGKWGMFSDVLYMDLGDTNTDSREFNLGQASIPADVTLDSEFDLKSWVWTIAGTYDLLDHPTNRSSLLLGARMVDIDQSLKFTFNGDIGPLPIAERTANPVVTATNWDAIVGIKGYSAMGEQHKWFVPYYLDVGAGDSDLTWQAMLGVGYSFSWGQTILSWRYLDYDIGEDVPIQSMTFSGPMLGVSFSW